LAASDRPQDCHSSHAADIANHIGQLNVHLRQCFLNMVDASAGARHQLLPLPHVGPQDPNVFGGPEGIIGGLGLFFMNPTNSAYCIRIGLVLPVLVHSMACKRSRPPDGSLEYTRKTDLVKHREDTVLKRLLLIFGIAGLMAATASAETVNYNTTGSTLSCNGVIGCVQDTTTEVTVGGLTFSYNNGSGSGVVTPSIINLGNIDTTGTGTSVNVTGLLLTINMNSTPPGAGGTLPNGDISGSLSTNNSGAIILFAPNNTTTAFGTLPGVVISGGGNSFTYQVLNPTLGLQAPTVGNPVGLTSIQGDVVFEATTPTPEPTMFLFLLGTGLAMVGVIRLRATR
jgi:hypothetical protein